MDIPKKIKCKVVISPEIRKIYREEKQKLRKEAWDNFWNKLFNSTNAGSKRNKEKYL